jgi:hypothetical protein
MSALALELKRVASFSEVGELKVRPAEIVEPRERHRLADELELPTAGEVDFALARAGLGGRPVPMWLAAGAGLAGFAVVTILLIAFSSRSGDTSPAAASVAGPGAPVPSEPRPVAVPPGQSPVVVSAAPTANGLTGSPAASVRDRPEAPTESTARVRPKIGKTTAPAAQPNAPSTSRNPSTGKQKMVGGDIIDPWSR